ncbi:membrane protein insertase YidC [Verrucomicrobia bacterium]|jgi:YidC/Oxa1 family membrane protein insertase|nr:membrane protein insertase YidC [bacterium]MDB4746339.1 membrane protein insertase YidC [Verrucomicrobiota bacterium]MDB4798693.1 membrane protein insertase YidC [Verrucomicrobiota bacterium]
MDRKSFTIFALSFVLLLAWGPFVNKVLYPSDERERAVGTNEVSGVEVPLGEGSIVDVSETATQTVAPSPTVALPVAIPVVPGFEIKTVTLENDLASYQFSNAGGGIDLVDLKQYPEDTSCDVSEESVESEQSFAQLNPWSSGPILGLRLGETPISQGYEITKDADTVSMVLSLENGLRIEKEFELGTNYLVRAKTRIVNTTTTPLNVPAQYWAVGTSTPLSPEDNGILMGLMYYDGSDIERVKESWFANRTLGCFPGTPRSEFSYGETPVNWGSVDNQFFTVALIPAEAASQVVATQAPLQFEDGLGSQFTIKKGFHAELAFEGAVLQPDEALERNFDVFAGPKEYNTLAQLSSSFGNELDGIMDFDGFFGFFAKALLLSMNGLHGFGLSYGFSIVAITFIIKILFWPLTQASTRSMKRMGALQPQMKELQAKYKDDPQKMNKKLMEFMRENRVSPLGGCLPILLQLPVFFGFYTMLQSAIELRGASFLWTCDLSKPDTLFIIPGLEVPFNLWPILMGAAQLWQTSMTPPSPGMDPAQQKIMKYMPLMFVFILYNFSAGLALYWTVQNLLSIAQMKLTKNEPITTTVSKSPLGKKKLKGKKGRPGL